MIRADTEASMTTATFLALALMLPATLASALPARTAAAEEAVRAADAARITALVANDLASLAPMLADDLTYTHSSGATDTKAQFLEALRSGRSRYTSVIPRDVTVRVYGQAAVMTGLAAVSVTVNGRPLDLDLAFTSVYVQKDGRWQFTAWQSTRVAEG
jgi:uncharacterized protein (TIGR02246 family)